MTAVHSASSMRPASASALKPPKTTECGAPMPRAGEHRDRQLGDHRHVDGDPVALAHAERAEGVGEAADLVQQLGVGDRAGVARLALPVVGDLVAQAGGDVAVEAVDADVQLPADEPLRVGQLPGVEVGPGLDPVEPVALLGPERAEALFGGGALEMPASLRTARSTKAPAGGKVRSSRSRFSIVGSACSPVLIGRF